VSKEQYEAWSRVVAFSLKVVGVVGIVFILVFWAITDRVQLAFLPFFGTMAGVGLGVDVLREISLAKGGERVADGP